MSVILESGDRLVVHTYSPKCQKTKPPKDKAIPL